MHVRLILLVFCFLTFTAPIAAQPVGPIPPVEPGRLAAYNAGLYTLLDMSQTIDEVTIGLDWAYADPWLIEVGLKPQRNPKGSKIISADLRLVGADIGSPTLSGGFAGADAHWFEWRYANFLDVPMGRLPIYNGFDKIPDELDFELVVVVQMPPIPPTLEPRQPTLDPEVTPDPTPRPEPIFQEFRFELSLPVYPVHIIQTDTKYEKNGVTFSVNQLAITPVKTVVDICYEIEGSDGSWVIDNIDAYFESNETSNYEAQGIPIGRFEGWYDERCGYINAQVAYAAVGSSFTLEIPHITRTFYLGYEQLVAIQQHLKTRGIEMTIDTDKTGQYFGYSLSESVDLEAVAVELDLTERINGPWVIKVPFYPVK